MPFFSVVIPCFNRADMVCDAIDSVLLQTINDYEIIVVDDGSSDNTIEVLSKYKDFIKLERQPNSGVAAARNRGLSAAIGRYVCYLDSDDIWAENKLEVYKAAIEDNSDPDFLFSDFSKHDVSLPKRYDVSNTDMFSYIYKFSQKTSGEYYKLQNTSLLELLLSGYPLYPSTFSVKREVHDNFRWDPGILKSEDFNFVLRVSTRHDFIYIDRDLATVRVHQSNKSADFLMKDRTNHASMRLYRDLYAKGANKLLCNYYISRRQFLDGRTYISKGLFRKGIILIVSSLGYRENWSRLAGKIWGKINGR
ncbi:glycosyltransferase family 2 protein [Marinobacter fonticola]|uniref:glycosyltransferase family 2 protein n=1 Tax=Marinobacter fonticola TaxID=2603215 RepID=UPI0011E85118|nr:glycosyltransferase family 2 protein [Marinobacter fonticola]